MTTAILNTPPEAASARMLSAVLQRLLMGGRRSWHYYVPAAGLGPTFVDPALARIKGRGGVVHLGCGVQSVVRNGERVTKLITTKGEVAILPEDKIICATSSAVAHSLLPDSVPKLDYQPILNAHFRWPQAGIFRDTMPFMGTVGGMAEWVFLHEGRISTTTSAAGSCMDQDEDTLARRLWHDICTALFLPTETKMPPYRIIKEKRATFAATPENIARLPSAQTALANLRLAGDYLDPTLPATIEAAISSGFEAAFWVNQTGQ